MSSLLGLSAYSDDEEDTVTGNAVPAPHPPPATIPVIAGLSAYVDSDDEEDYGTAPSPSPTTSAVPSAPTSAHSASDSTANRAPHSTLIPPVTLRPSASLQQMPTLKSNFHPHHTPGEGLNGHRSASSNDIAGLKAQRAASASGGAHGASAGAFIPPPTSSELATLPPLPSGPLAPALAARHETNLARQRAQAANPRAKALVQSLLANKSFHNPYILSRIATQLEIREHGTNLSADHWREQNLDDGQEEDDYLTIQRQAEEFTAARLQNRTSIDFVQPTQPASAVSTSGSTIATVNPDGSITRVRVFDQSASNDSNAAPPRPRKSKWDATTSNPPPPTTGNTSIEEESARKRQKL